ncbi:MAG: carboxypeptidase regulatory-like domain-containing protein, partial [Planctomycetaceae bacterium]|nr:carboxypeptidase regulatory-like domain-containing protein [Planctomycetaceae bacterium]
MKNRVFFCPLVLAVMLFSGVAFPLCAEETTEHVIAFPEIRWNIPETITLTVVDEADKPLAEMQASFSMTDMPKENADLLVNPPDRFEISDLVTDTNGKIVIEIPLEKRKNPPLNMDLSVPGKGLLMPESVGWSMRVADDSGLVTVPDEVKITMKEGKMFRLNVVDEDGNPVAGAKIGYGSFFFPFRDQDWPQSFTLTDENGVSTRGPVPKDFNERRLLYDRKIYHSDFVRWPIGRESPGTTSRFSEKVIDEYTVMLKRGRTIIGIIRDAEGQPVAGADLFVGGQDDGAEREAQTDENGKFEIKGLLDLPLVFVVRKPDKVRFVKKITPDQFDEPLEITMQPAKTLRVQLLTDEGKPYNSQFGLVHPPIDMGAHEYSYNLTYGFQLSDGRWEWDEAPDEEVDYRLQIVSYTSPKPGERRVIFPLEKEVFSFRPREEPYQIILKTREFEPGDDQRSVFRDSWQLPEKLEVRVLGEDGNPKPGATVTMACHTGTGTWAIQARPQKLMQSFTTDADGVVRFDFSKVRQRTTEFDIRVSADHCLTTHCSWKSNSMRGFRRFGRPIGERLDILIASDQKTTGFVRDEEGNPVEGAEVTLYRIQNCIYLGETHQPLDRTATLLTNANGKWECDLVLPKDFSMSPLTYLDRNYVEIKKDGYLDSKTPVSANERFVTLKRTKKITGRVVDENGQPLKDVQVAMSASQTVPQYGAQTDGDGRFEMGARPLDESQPFGESQESGILAWQPGRQSAWQLLDLSRDVENVELVLKPGAVLRVRFDRDEDIPFPNLSFHVALNREPRIGPSFQNLKPDENGIILLEGVPAPTPELEVAVLVYNADDLRRYRAEKDNYVFQYGEEELRIRIIDAMTLPKDQRQYGTYVFSAGGLYGTITYQGD